MERACTMDSCDAATENVLMYLFLVMIMLSILRIPVMGKLVVNTPPKIVVTIMLVL